MKRIFLFLILSVVGNMLLALPNIVSEKDTLPYYSIGEYPKDYTAETVVARMIDGLGFRYYWATEGLRPQDLSFRPTPKARSSEETIDHVLGLSEWILKPVKGEINTGSGEETSKLSFAVKRERTLNNLKEASDLLKSGKLKVADIKIKTGSGKQKNEFPFWNDINGPISDAIWHVGQVVTFRRSSGNPFDGKANVFMGKYQKGKN